MLLLSFTLYPWVKRNKLMKKAARPGFDNDFERQIEYDTEVIARTKERLAGL